MSLNNNKQLIRRMKVLQNTILCEETICTNRSLSSRLKLAAPYVYLDYATYELATFGQNVSAGKRLVTYIFPFAGFWAFRVYYLDTVVDKDKANHTYLLCYGTILSLGSENAQNSVYSHPSYPNRSQSHLHSRLQ